MAQYKVPQDVEADDKLIGPFSFRQFVYLIVAAGLCFVAFLLFQIFPLLVIIPVPFIIFLGLLALPVKKDQPMETYLAAVVDFYLKPQKRIWMPGQPDSTITIAAPKNVEENRKKDLSQEEAGRRLSFLANIVDTEGYAIKDNTNSNLRDDVASEAADTQDIFEQNQNYTLEQSLEQSTANRRAQLVAEMQNAIKNAEAQAPQPTIQHTFQPAAPEPQPTLQQMPQPSFQSPNIATTPVTVVAPVVPVIPTTPAAPSFQPTPTAPVMPAAPVAPTIPTMPTTPVAPAPPSAPAAPEAPPFLDGPVDIAASSATIQPDLDEIHEALTNPDADETLVEEGNVESEPIADDNLEAEPITEEDTVAEAEEPEPIAEPEPIEPEETITASDEPVTQPEEQSQGDDNEVYISLH